MTSRQPLTWTSMASASRCAAPRIRISSRERAVTPTTSISPVRPTQCSFAAAKAMPGVLAIYTGHDLAAYGNLKCVAPFKNRDGSEMKKPVRYSMHTDKVRFVGDPLAIVVAETLAQAKDAAEAVEVDIDVLPAVTKASDAAAPGAPQLYDDVPNNVALDYHYGDATKVTEAFASAAHVTK